jgi:hypothetical protein
MLALLLLLYLSLLSRSQPLSTPPATPFPAATTLSAPALEILQLGAALDRGQAYNPTSGAYYESSMLRARSSIEALIASASPPASIAPCLGEWELVLSTVPHGIFRSSPFFLAVQEAFSFAENKTAFGQDKAGLFFKLHELQTCSWGVSKVGRVGQRILPDGRIYSEFDTSIFSLTVIPILGWFKLLPTFGGCVITKADYEAEPTEEGLRMAMNVDYTTSRPVPGLSGLGEFIWRIKVSAGSAPRHTLFRPNPRPQVPVRAVWRLLPWTKGRGPTCELTQVYADELLRVARDRDGEFFVYSRPTVPREFGDDV